MAGIAAYSFINMNAVIEVDEIRKIVHPIPHRRFAAAEALAHGFQHGRSRPNLRVAVHAGLGRRNASKTRSLDRSMAIAAINPQACNVMLVAEWRGLRPGNSRIGHVG